MPSATSFASRPLDLVTARLPTTVRDGRVAVSRTAAAGLAFLALLALVLAGSYAWRGRAVQAVLPTDPTSTVLAAALGVPDQQSWADLATQPGRRGGGRRRRQGPASRESYASRSGLGSSTRSRQPVASAATSTSPASTSPGSWPDGEQVVVGVGGAAPARRRLLARAAAAPDDAVVDLNTATLEQLDTLPGVGPVLAQRILDWRTAHGRFSTIDELREVSGIGDSRFADLAPRVRV